MPKERNPEEVEVIEPTPEEKYEALLTENKRLTEENSKLKTQNEQVIKAFNKLLEEYNQLHVQSLLK